MADSVLTWFTVQRDPKCLFPARSDNRGVNMHHVVCVKPHLGFSGTESTAQAAMAKSQDLELSQDQPLSLHLCRAM